MMEDDIVNHIIIIISYINLVFSLAMILKIYCCCCYYYLMIHYHHHCSKNYDKLKMTIKKELSRLLKIYILKKIIYKIYIKKKGITPNLPFIYIMKQH
jgi:hypothetical protein